MKLQTHADVQRLLERGFTGGVYRLDGAHKESYPLVKLL